MKVENVCRRFSCIDKNSFWKCVNEYSYSWRITFAVISVNASGRGLIIFQKRTEVDFKILANSSSS
jgi:hypothetical protein